MNRILVPVDFSVASANATGYAMRLAGAMGAAVELLHVYKDLIPATVGAEPWTVAVSHTRSEKETLLREEVQRISNKYGLSVEGAVQTGFKVHCIRKAAKKMDADLIILGRRDRAKIAGGTIAKLLRRTRREILVVPESWTAVIPKRIVLAIDFIYLSNETCFDTLLDLVSVYDSSLNVIHVEATTGSGEKQSLAKLEIGRMLSRFTYVYDILKSKNVAATVLQYVESHPADMLVMVSRHHLHKWNHFASLTIESVLRKCSVPVLILKGDDF